MAINSNASRVSETNQTNISLFRKLEEEVEANLTNEQFGVEELAERMSMSRSNLHRKLKQSTGQSISQFIREYRLKRSLDFLEKGNMTVSEVSYQVGFGSPSYFTSCFTDYYGFPPGESKYRLNAKTSDNRTFSNNHKTHFKRSSLIFGGLILAGLLIAFILYQQIAVVKTEREMNVGAVENSIAVLPFKNLNLDEDVEYLTSGVVGEINSRLSRIPSLKVTSQITADRYSETSLSAKEIGQELGVLYLLGGSIQRSSSTLRIEVHLTNVLTEEQVWGEVFDKRFDDLLTVQSIISGQVATELLANLSNTEKTVINENGTDNAEAYDLYLKGKYILRSWREDRFRRSTLLFQQAIALDSTYAQAYVGLAASFMYRAAMCCSDLNPDEAFPLAKPQLERALELNPDLIEAHIWNGYYYLFGKWDFARAEEEFKKGITTNDPHGLSLYVIFLNLIGRHKEALIYAEQLDETNPFYLITRMPVSLYYANRYDEAIEFASSRLKTSQNLISFDNIGFIMLNTGDYAGAIHHFLEIIDLREGVMYPRLYGWLGAAYARSGNQTKALEFIEELKVKKAAGKAGSFAFFIAVIYNALGDKTSALQWLKESVNIHDMEVVWLKSEPQLFSLHDEPEFQKLLDTVGFP